MISDRDIDVLARTVYGEARGESELGRLAVAWVVRNRAERAGWSLAEACLKSIHFSCWNNAAANDRNQLAMLRADSGDAVYAKCLIAALEAAHGLAADPTGGARHYHALGIKPTWAHGVEDYVTIGGHRFYRGIA